MSFAEVYDILFKRVVTRFNSNSSDYSLKAIRELIEDSIKADGASIIKYLNQDIVKATTKINNMLTVKKDKMIELAQEKKKLFLDLREIYTPLNRKVCVNCTRCCCGSGDGYYCMTDAIYIATLGETIEFSVKDSKERVAEMLSKGNRQCSFNNKGCTIPPHLRSTVCVSYRCDSLERDLSIEVQSSMRAMKERISKIDYAMAELYSKSTNDPISIRRYYSK
jgi:hypothetical protein